MQTTGDLNVRTTGAVLLVFYILVEQLVSKQITNIKYLPHANTPVEPRLIRF